MGELGCRREAGKREAPLDLEEEIRAAELRRLNADAGKLESEAKKLDAEVRRFRNTTIMGVVKLGVLVIGACLRAQRLWTPWVGYRRRNMIERHEVLPSGLKVDREWWFTTKVVTVVVAAVVIGAAAALLL